MWIIVKLTFYRFNLLYVSLAILMLQTVLLSQGVIWLGECELVPCEMFITDEPVEINWSDWALGALIIVGIVMVFKYTFMRKLTTIFKSELFTNLILKSTIMPAPAPNIVFEPQPLPEPRIPCNPEGCVEDAKPRTIYAQPQLPPEDIRGYIFLFGILDVVVLIGKIVVGTLIGLAAGTVIGTVVMEAVDDAFMAAVDFLAEPAGDIIETIARALEPVVEIIAETVTYLVDTFVSIFIEGVVRTIAPAFNAILEFIEFVVQDVAQITISFIEGVIRAFTPIVETIFAFSEVIFWAVAVAYRWLNEFYGWYVFNILLLIILMLIFR